MADIIGGILLQLNVIPEVKLAIVPPVTFISSSSPSLILSVSQSKTGKPWFMAFRKKIRAADLAKIAPSRVQPSLRLFFPEEVRLARC